jgi:hypothetical protein
MTDHVDKTMGIVTRIALIPEVLSRIKPTDRLRLANRYSVCDRSVCMLSGTSIAVMSHCDIHHECSMTDPIDFIFSTILSTVESLSD